MSHLILTVKLNEPVHIGNDITVTPYELKNGAVMISIQAPLGVSILRSKVAKRIEQERCTCHPATSEPPPASLTEEIRNSRKAVLSEDEQIELLRRDRNIPPIALALADGISTKQIEEALDADGKTP
jgi:carbon storage regulator CsrA